jgi:hypothetical protein
VNGRGAAGSAIVIGNTKLGDSGLGADGKAEARNGLRAGVGEAAAGSGGGLFEATGAAVTAVGNGGGPLRTGGGAAGAATECAAAVGGTAAGFPAAL